MNVNTSSAQFTASYSGAMGYAKAGRIEYSDLSKAVKADLPRVEATWEDHLKISETVNEDGTITRTMSGGAYVSEVPNRGREASYREGSYSFSVSLTFDPETYEGGDLGATADLLAAAHAADEKAARTLFSGEAQIRELQRLDEVYEGQKNQVIQSFAGMVSVYLEATTQSGQEEEKVSSSIRAIFSTREAKYRALANGTRQELWMSSSRFEAAINLQRLGAAFPVKEEPVSGLYSLQELEAAALRVSRGFSING